MTFSFPPSTPRSHLKLLLQLLLLRLQFLLLGVVVGDAALLLVERRQQLVPLPGQLGVLVVQLFLQSLLLLDGREGLLGLRLQRLPQGGAS